MNSRYYNYTINFNGQKVFKFRTAIRLFKSLTVSSPFRSNTATTTRQTTIRIWSRTIRLVFCASLNSTLTTSRSWWWWVFLRHTAPKTRRLSTRTCFSMWRDIGRPATTLLPIRTNNGFYAGSARWNRYIIASPIYWWRNVSRHCRVSTMQSRGFLASWWHSASWTIPTSFTRRITATIWDSLDWSKVRERLAFFRVWRENKKKKKFVPSLSLVSQNFSKWKSCQLLFDLSCALPFLGGWFCQSTVCLMYILHYDASPFAFEWGQKKWDVFWETKCIFLFFFFLWCFG